MDVPDEGPAAAAKARGLLRAALERATPALRSRTHLFDLGEESCRVAAAAATGLADFGPDDHLVPMRTLLASLDDEVGLDLAGRAAARRWVVDRLVARLEMVAAEVSGSPGAAEPLAQPPIIVVGMPGGAVELLVELLALDLGNRAPSWADVAARVAADGHGGGGGRTQAASAALLSRLAPEATDGRGAGSLLGPAFTDLAPAARLGAASYFAAFAEVDPKAQADWLDRALSFAPPVSGLLPTPVRWLLGAPQLSFCLDALRESHPAARVVVVGQEPVGAVARSAQRALDSSPATTATSAANRVSFGQAWLDLWAEGAGRLAASVRRDSAGGGGFIDVDEDQVFADPSGAVEQVYAAAGLEMGLGTTTRVKAFAIEHRGRFGPRPAVPEVPGIDLGQAAARFTRPGGA